MDRAMDRQVAADRLFDVAFGTHDLVLSPAEFGALGRLPDVAAVGADVRYPAQVTAGGRRQAAAIWGIDLPAQPVDAIRLVSGRLPRSGEVLADAANGSAADLATGIGTRIEVRDSDGAHTVLRVSGTAAGLATSPSPAGSGSPVFYASEATVRSLAGLRGINFLAFRLSDNTPATEAKLVSAVHGYLKRLTGTEPFVALPATRGQGVWPQRSFFDHVIALFNVITLLAVCCAVFLIAATMNTLIVEQAGQIAILTSLGARRHQIAGVVLRTAGMLGGAGAIAGTALGIAISYVLTSYFAATLFDVRAGFAISVPVVVASLAGGPALAVAASLPGLWRAAACCPGRRAWDCATRCGRSAAARPRSRRSPSPPGSRSRCSRPAGRSTSASARCSRPSTTRSRLTRPTGLRCSAAGPRRSRPRRRASPGRSRSWRPPWTITGTATWRWASAPMPCTGTGSALAAG
jgi:hypothetical protein